MSVDKLQIGQQLFVFSPTIAFIRIQAITVDGMNSRLYAYPTCTYRPLLLNVGIDLL